MAPSTINFVKSIVANKRSHHFGTMAKVKFAKEIEKRLSNGEKLMKILEDVGIEKNTWWEWESIKNKHERSVKGSKKLENFFVKIKKEPGANA